MSDVTGSLPVEINHDLHIHTYLSTCCADPENQRPGKIVALAKSMGLKTIGFSDHIWTNKKVKPSPWYAMQNETNLTLLREDLGRADTEGIRVLVGCEADTKSPGQFTIDKDLAESLDYVLLSCDHFHLKDFVQPPWAKAPRDIADHMINFFCSAVQSGLATIIPHPFKPYGFLHKYDDIIASIDDEELLEAFSMASEIGVAIEITLGFFPIRTGKWFWKRDMWSLETPVRILTLAKQAGCKFTLGSDAHHPGTQKMLFDLKKIIDLAGITQEDIHSLVNTQV
jgi:histidinol phosphatase-like PHP family hydrolase